MKQRMPFTRLTDPQWEALRPHLARTSPAGRPLPDLRARMDGMLFLLSTDAPWRELPEAHGAAATVARHFRRLTHAGLWERLLRALHDAAADHPLQSLRGVIFRGARRAYRLRGLGLIVLARRLGLRGALPGPSWLLPNPDLSERLVELQLRLGENLPDALRHWGGALRRLMGIAAGRAQIPRSVRLFMP